MQDKEQEKKTQKNETQRGFSPTKTVIRILMKSNRGGNKMFENCKHQSLGGKPQGPTREKIGAEGGRSLNRGEKHLIKQKNGGTKSKGTANRRERKL